MRSPSPASRRLAGRAGADALTGTVDLDALEAVINAVTQLAMRYREVTGKPLGITGEIGEFRVARLLGWQLTEARQAGYDAVAPDGHRIQVKARCILPSSGPGQRIGTIKLTHDWDTVALILMDQAFAPLAIFEAGRSDIERELTRPGSRARNERGALAVAKFKSIATLLWPSRE